VITYASIDRFFVFIVWPTGTEEGQHRIRYRNWTLGKPGNL